MRKAGYAALLATLLAAATGAGAQQYPTKPVRIVIGLSAGGGTDVLTRLIAQRLTDAWGQQVVVENRPGASGFIAGELVAKSPPDGYTLIMGAQSGLAVAPALYGRAPYDTVKDFTPVTQAGSTPLLMIVHPSFPAKSFGEFVTYAKKAPTLTYGSGGVGSTPHMAGELLNSLLSIRMNHVPYKGENPAIADTLGGQIPIMFGNISVAVPHVKAGKLRALANTSGARSQLVPEVPTIAESGFKGFAIATWYGLLGPAGMPPAVTSRIQGDVAKAVAQPETRDKLVNMGVDVVASPPDQFAAYLRSEVARYVKLVKDNNLKAE
ncbi:MAG TPA: tripartite tricarboxylate transporter substrate binding protein [Burkholderiales bacterium]|nr:tripartite tricarboxylate transporter substrate binding protein [Burkholderiales bacterium]